ncbi:MULTISPECIES: nuclear transport factor 2 family protein [unclassified Caballeronia]|uniref:YybH family protein n=1 Tax=unclassified Caballeronia TaxID=2646786 RepID=UPI0028552BF6|nr:MULTISPECIES: nuclear transport factor 2 family protein [unclassified Caballeronia]MDR5825198.1 nuclear transport factor 2 family protein [Caballeronia sp. LZ043]MDR5883071.1 nuclear transport factor 2 family protein [Caballeronia sp. LZ032]
MNPSNDRAQETEEVRAIRALIEAWRQAVLAKDVDALVRHYAEDVVVFDVVPPASLKGVEPYREHWQHWFDSMKGPLAFEMRDVEVAASGDLAFAHSVNCVAVGEQDDIVRATVCFRKIGGEWRVVHEHASVPLMMDMDPDEKS